MARGGKQYKSEADPFVIILFGIVTMVISFGVTLVLLGSDSSTIPLTVETTGGGLRLIYPTAQKTDHSPGRAFDGSTDPDSFWEAQGPFPIEFTIEFPNPRTLSGYALKAGENPSRMPSMWSAEGSRDGRTWMLLDQQEGKGPWGPYDSQKFPLTSDQPLRQLRFRFLAGLNNEFLRIYEIELH
jgi:hypothetical protein